MTVIAWDGRTLAADKQSTVAGYAHTVTKIARDEHGVLIGATGNTGHCHQMRAWWHAGADPDKFPKAEDSASLLVVVPHGPGAPAEVRLYDGSPVPVIYEERQVALGSGRDYAMMAMRLGKTAREAVELTCEMEIHCGRGVDALDLNKGDDE